MKGMEEFDPECGMKDVLNVLICAWSDVDSISMRMAWILIATTNATSRCKDIKQVDDLGF
jgi:hypothetical protein